MAEITKKPSKKDQIKPAPVPQNKKFFESTEQLLAAAKWLRESRNGLESYEGAVEQRRAEFFRGDEFVTCLTGAKWRKKKFVPANLTRSEAVAIGQQMLKAEYFHRVQIKHRAKASALDDLDYLTIDTSNNTMEDSEEALYTWILEPSQRCLVVKSVLLLLGALFMCMWKVWPLWLKVVVWWISLIMLISLSAIAVLRVILYALLWIVGFRGYWLFPNFFSDEVDPLEAFNPLFGKAMDSKKIRQQARRAEQKAREKAKRLREKAQEQERAREDKADKDKDDKKDGKPKEDEEDKPARCEGWNFGLINFTMLMILGIILANQIGLFMPENIPDFIATQSDLYRQFPTLMPPQAANATNATVEVQPNATAEAETEVPELDDRFFDDKNLEEEEGLQVD